LSAKKNATREKLPHRRHRVLQPFAIAGRIARPRRAVGTLLAKRQIATQHRETDASKGFCQRHQQGHLRIAASSVGED